jgi:phosphoenolpyruvate carboxylase
MNPTALVKSFMGRLYDYRGFTLNLNPIHLENLMGWPAFKQVSDAFDKTPLVDESLSAADDRFFDKLLVTAVVTSIKSHYGSFETQIMLHRLGAAHALRLLSNVNIVALFEPDDYAKATKVLKYLLEHKIDKHLVIVNEYFEVALRYHNIWRMD